MRACHTLCGVCIRCCIQTASDRSFNTAAGAADDADYACKHSNQRVLASKMAKSGLHALVQRSRCWLLAHYNLTMQPAAAPQWHYAC